MPAVMPAGDVGVLFFEQIRMRSGINQGQCQNLVFD